MFIMPIMYIYIFAFSLYQKTIYNVKTYKSDDAIMADAYDFPNRNRAPPVAKRPALKKYGDVLPLLSTKEPNLRTPCDKLNSKNSF